MTTTPLNITHSWLYQTLTDIGKMSQRPALLDLALVRDDYRIATSSWTIEPVFEIRVFLAVDGIQP